LKPPKNVAAEAALSTSFHVANFPTSYLYCAGIALIAQFCVEKWKTLRDFWIAYFY
jgi:hypothetical protein